MSSNKKKVYIALGLVGILLIAGILIYSSSTKTTTERGKEMPTMEWVQRLNDATSLRTPFLENKVIVIDSSSETAFETSVAVSTASIQRMGKEMEASPLIMDDGDDDSLQRFLSLTDLEEL
jgi:hypothetical protein